jgi:hypothetical protein
VNAFVEVHLLRLVDWFFRYGRKDVHC